LEKHPVRRVGGAEGAAEIVLRNSRQNSLIFAPFLSIRTSARGYAIAAEREKSNVLLELRCECHNANFAKSVSCPVWRLSTLRRLETNSGGKTIQERESLKRIQKYEHVSCGGI
jgi:hypothetical protein